MRAIKYNGNLITFAGKILRMAEWVYQEGVHYLRVLAGGGTVANRGLVEDLYKLWEEQGRLDNIKVAILPQAGSVQRTSGIYRFFSKLFNLSGNYLLGSELIANGKFDTDLTGWTGDGGATISLDNGRMKVTNASYGYGSSRYNMTTVIGKKYYLTADFEYGNCNAQVIAYTGFDQNQNRVFVSSILSASGQFTGEFIATATLTRFAVYNPNAVNGGYSFWDNISVKEVISGTNTDVTQTTANSQPYVVNGAMVNPNGGLRFMTHPTVSFGANEAWSMSILLNWNAGGDSIAGNLTTSSLGLTGNFLYRYSLLTEVLELKYGTDKKTLPLIGKTTLISFVADGSGNVSVYKNGVLNDTLSGFLNGTPFKFSLFMQGRNGVYSTYHGRVFYQAISSGALTPTQILEEYNLLRSYIPEIATTLIGTDEIATENCQMVATPMGRVINLNNTAGNVEKLLNTSFATTANWTAQTDWTIAGDGQAVKVAGTSARYIYQDVVLTSGRYYKIRINTSAISGQIVITNQTGSPDTIFGGYFSVSSGDVTLYRLATGNATQIRLYGSYVTTMNLLDFEITEIGFAGASDLYTAIYNQTSGTVAQKTLAALKAAAMWRSPNSSLDDQAVFGKIYNGYAALLLQMDIDAYNAANPSTPWGYHVATLQDFQAIKDTLGGVETAGKKIKINGTDYWTSDNGDNTSGVQALGSGYIDENGEYKDYRAATGFWTVTENGDMLEVVTLRDELDELFITE